MAGALPTPIDCCGLQNCPTSSSGGGGGNTANLVFAHLAGQPPAMLTPLVAPLLEIDLDTNAEYAWNGIYWQTLVAPP